MSFSKPTIYISYSHEDVDRDSLDAFVNWLGELSNNELDALYDDDLNPGRDLREFMKKLYEVDATMIIMTPSYKRKILNRIKGGVYTEYKYIYGRYSEIEKKKKEGLQYDDFALIPILFSGTPESSVLDEFSNLKYTDFRNFRALRDKKDELIVPDSIKTLLKPEMKKILAEIMTVNSHNSPLYKEHYDELFKFLLTDTKAEWQTTSANIQIIKEVFVETYPYKKVETQSGYFLIGRKGSGKSTVAMFMANQDITKYKGVIPIIANDFNLEVLYGFFHLMA